VDVDTASQKGIYVCNTPEVVNDATSDLALFLILSVARRASEAERLVREGKWDNDFHPERCLGVNPRGKVLGILGMGKIGREVARKAYTAFGMHIQYSNRTRAEERIEKELDAKFVPSIEELCATSDFISVHVPLSSKTRHLLDKPQFDKMKRGIFLINTSRGAVINEEALASALESGIVRGAGLDVFEFEPKVHPKLLSHPGVTALPHIGSCARETRGQMWNLCIDNCVRVLRGQAPLTSVNATSLRK